MSCPCKRPASRPAFTLIELLAVIAVIAVLTAIVTVSVNQALAYARSSESRSNLRQIGVYTQLYATENNQKIPYGRWGFDRKYLWLNALYPLAYDEEFPGFIPSATGENLRGTIFYSPAMVPAEEGEPLRSYGWNNFIYDEDSSAGDADRRLSLNQVRQPSLHVLAGDTENASTITRSSINFRNSGRAHLLFLDGHIESRPPEEVPLEPSDPGYNIFWHFNLE